MTDIGELMERYDALLEEYRVLEREMEQRRRVMEQGALPPGRVMMGADTLEVRKLLDQAGIGKVEAAEWLGITARDLGSKLTGERKFKQWELTELTTMAKARLEKKWT